MGAEGRRTGRSISRTGSSSVASSLIVPLLKDKPYFIMTVVQSNIQRPFQVTVPKNFMKHLPNRRVEVTLCCHNRNRNRKVAYYGDMGRFCGGWKDFAEENNLKVGDGVVFELEDARRLEFRVQILWREIPTVDNVRIEID